MAAMRKLHRGTSVLIVWPPWTVHVDQTGWDPKVRAGRCRLAPSPLGAPVAAMGRIDYHPHLTRTMMRGYGRVAQSAGTIICAGSNRQTQYGLGIPKEDFLHKQRTYDRIARLYDILDLPFEHGRYKPLRRAMFEGVKGTLLDAGVGTGRNFPFYPSGSKVIGIDLSPAMLKRARQRRDVLGTPVELRDMNVMEMEFEDDSFDAVISTFLFCVLD